MPRGRGQIPPYGKFFRRERTSYRPGLSSTIYVLKQDSAWFIRSDTTSHKWQIFCTYGTAEAFPQGLYEPTLTAAMIRLLDGIDYGYYATAESVRFAIMPLST